MGKSPERSSSFDVDARDCKHPDGLAKDEPEASCFFSRLVYFCFVFYIALTAYRFLTSFPVSQLAGSSVEVQPKEAGAVRLLSFNIFMLPLLEYPDRSSFKNERILEFVDRFLAKYDIVCLQELFAFGNRRRSSFLAVARSLGFPFSTAAPYGAVDGGLVIVSRFPIREAAWCPYGLALRRDRLANKGILYAKVQVSGKQVIHLFNTHLQSSNEGTVKPPASDSDMRIEQLKKLKLFVKEKAREKGCVVVAGDFNINASLPSVDFYFLCDQFFPDFYAPSLEEDGRHPTYGVHKSCYRLPHPFIEEAHLTEHYDRQSCQQLDYIFVGKTHSPRFAFRLNPMLSSSGKYSHLSDHYGLEIDFYPEERLLE